ncbi:MAG TPA: GNAT family N-acetyltransferase [Solirubrobacteraceae bacterium]|nr:GNAT family N-acetyltransferase [Solirubrobacteraceae bacterium]
MEIRRLRSADADVFREIRLRALAEAPYAFGSSLAQETANGPEFWQGRVDESATARKGAIFAAIGEDRRALAMAGGFFPQLGDEEAVLWGMWVSPHARRGGLGRRLLAEVVDWARSCGARRLRLCVSETDRSRAAAALYVALGFSEVGEREPLPSDPTITTVTMVKDLASGDSPGSAG